MTQENSSVRTATLKLLLDTLIDLGTPARHQKTIDAASRGVMGQMEALTKAQEAATRVFEAEQAVGESAFMRSVNG